MRTSEFCRFALGICVAAAMFGGCGSRSDNGAALPPNGATLPPNGAGKVLSHHRSFYYTGREQRFRVPPSIKWIGVVVRGGGGANASGSGASGGRGGRVHAYIPVTPGETLAIYVGGEGQGMSGGFNGGADGGQRYYCNCPGAGGGGASDVRQGGDGLANRVLVVGGQDDMLGAPVLAGSAAVALVGITSAAPAEEAAAARAALAAAAAPVAGTGLLEEEMAARRVPAARAESVATATITAGTRAITEHSSTAEPAVRTEPPTVQVPGAVVVAEATTAAGAAALVPRFKATAISMAAVVAAAPHISSPALRVSEGGKAGRMRWATVSSLSAGNHERFGDDRLASEDRGR